MNLSSPVRMVLASVAVVDMMLFTSAGLLPLAGAAIGLVTVLIGIAYHFRPAAIVGLLIVSAVAGAAVQVPTLTELGYLVMSALGLLLPVLVLFWISFTSEQGSMPAPSSRPVAVAGIFAGASLVSVPVVVAVLGLFVPRLSAGLEVMAESATVLLTVTVLGVAFMWRGASGGEASVAAESKGAGGNAPD